MSNHMDCPLCDEAMLKVIYMGLPFRLCSDERCSLIDGFWDFIFWFVPFNGVFLVYEDGYVSALIGWLTNDEY